MDFTWHDGERVIRFGRGAAAEAVDLLGGPGYALLTTARSRTVLPAVFEAHARDGRVAFEYDTRMFLGRLA